MSITYISASPNFNGTGTSVDKRLKSFLFLRLSVIQITLRSGNIRDTGRGPTGRGEITEDFQERLREEGFSIRVVCKGTSRVDKVESGDGDGQKMDVPLRRIMRNGPDGPCMLCKLIVNTLPTYICTEFRVSSYGI